MYIYACTHVYIEMKEGDFMYATHLSKHNKCLIAGLCLSFKHTDKHSLCLCVIVPVFVCVLHGKSATRQTLPHGKYLSLHIYTIYINQNHT